MAKDAWKSIKFERYEEESLPSGKMLWHCFFKDNHGNKYRWTPRWRDVEDIFVKAMDIESRNESEGVWDEELKKLLERVPFRQHDIDIFEKSDAMMNEQGLEGFLWNLEMNEFCMRSQWIKVDKFLQFFNYESNRYVSRTLYELAEKVCDTLDELCKFLDDKIYPYRLGDGSDVELCLYPDYEVVGDQKLTRQEWEEQFHCYVAELKKLVLSARQAYKAYRIAIRQILFK